MLKYFKGRIFETEIRRHRKKDHIYGVKYIK